MAVLDIVQYPDPVLRKKCSPVEEITPDLQKLIDDMIETMYDAPGVGLAANQVGVSLRLVVIDVWDREEEHPVLVLVNPEIIAQEGESEEEEGCLSVKGYNAVVKRYASVKVRAHDRHGNSIDIEAEGLLAKALQHEVDHINGLIFVDRLSPLKRDLFKRKVKKELKKEGAEAS